MGNTHQNSFVSIQGDSGSPLTINGVQIGIVSFLKTTICEESVAEFYTRVPKYVNWIKEKLGPDAAHLKFANLKTKLQYSKVENYWFI